MLFFLFPQNWFNHFGRDAAHTSTPFFLCTTLPIPRGQPKHSSWKISNPKSKIQQSLNAFLVAYDEKCSATLITAKSTTCTCNLQTTVITYIRYIDRGIGWNNKRYKQLQLGSLMFSCFLSSWNTCVGSVDHFWVMFGLTEEKKRLNPAFQVKNK